MDSLSVWANSVVVMATFFTIAIGAKYVVDSAAALAERANVSQLAIGLTVVAFGTSAPEFGVTLVAAFEGRSAISVGNIVGSNIFNLGFILGGAAFVRAIPTGVLIVWRDTLALVGATVLLFLLIGLDLHLGAVDGAILFLSLLVYLRFIWHRRRYRDGPKLSISSQDRPRRTGVAKQAGLLLFGLTLVALGSHYLVGSASAIARSVGMSEWVIAVTIVAAGTSVPEFATTLAGVVRGHMAISAGNVIGSDLFNVLGVLGVAGLAHPMALEPAARASLLALVGMVVVVLVIMRTGWRISRAEGFALLLLAVLRWTLDIAGHA